MRYVRLNHARLRWDLAATAATGPVCRGGSSGELIVTDPARNGVYYMAFTDHAHCIRFVGKLSMAGVPFELFNELPGGVTFKVYGCVGNPLTKVATVIDPTRQLARV